MKRSPIRLVWWALGALAVLLLAGASPTMLAVLLVLFFLLTRSGLERRLSTSVAEVVAATAALAIGAAVAASSWDPATEEHWRDWAAVGLVGAALVGAGCLGVLAVTLGGRGGDRATAADRRLASMLGRARTLDAGALTGPWSGPGRRVGVAGALMATAATAVSIWLAVVVLAVDGVGAWCVPWALCMLAVLQLRRRESTPTRAESRRRVAERTVLAAAAVLVAVLLAAPLAALADLVPQLPMGGSGSGFSAVDRATSYWGFDGVLDTSMRGELSDEEVLRVRADTPQLWAAATYDQWDGRYWTAEVIEADPSEEAFDDDLLGPGGSGAVLTQEVTALQPMGTVVVGATELIDVSGIDVVRDELGDVFAYDWVDAGTTYTSRSRLPDMDPEVLGSVDAREIDELPSAIEAYLQPLPTTDRVAAAARSVTATSTNDHERVQALMEWIRSRVRYDRDSPVPADGEDAVDRFLFEDRVGFCEQIASSLVVMTRELGIPSRLTVGFVPSERVGADVWVSRGDDAHAWVEVWLPAQGWVGFDPTAGVPEVRSEDELGPVVIAALVATVVIVAVVVVWWLRRRARRRTDGGAVAPSQLGSLVARFDRIGADHIGPRAPEETLIEYGRRLDHLLQDEQASALAATLSSAAYAVPVAGYGPPGTDEAVGELVGRLARLEPAGTGEPADP